MPGVHALSIGSPGKGTHPPSARAAVQSPRAIWQPRPKLIPALKPSPLKPAVLASTPPTSNRNSGTGGNRRRPESSGSGGSPVDAAMGGESANSDSAGMDVDPQPLVSKRGRHSQGKEQQTPAMPPTIKNDHGSGRVTRSKAAGPAGVQHR